MELISVIVPVYKVEEYLSKCVDSIRKQTYTNLEIILVDDGSPDRCGTICDEYAKQDKRIKVIHKENGGLSDARNAGIDIAMGSLIAFVDSDDEIVPEMYQKLYQSLVSEHADMSICNFCYVGDGVYDNEDFPIKNELITGREILCEKMLGNKPWYWEVAWNKLYRKRLFQNVRYPVGKIHEDAFVLHKLMLNCNKVACLEDVLYHYLQRSNSIMGNGMDIRHLDAVEALLERLEDYLKIEMSSEVRKATLEISRGSLYRCYGKVTERSDITKDRYREIRKKYRKLIPKMIKSANATEWIKLVLDYINPYILWKIRYGKMYG